MTSPLEREILTHYAIGVGPYLGGSEHWRDVHVQTVNRFIGLGLLRSVGEIGEAPHIEGNKAALWVYLDALAAVPLPVQRWVVPDLATAVISIKREGEKT